MNYNANNGYWKVYNKDQNACLYHVHDSIHTLSYLHYIFYFTLIYCINNYNLKGIIMFIDTYDKENDQ